VRPGGELGRGCIEDIRCVCCHPRDNIGARC
jgi:hypothetical protein